MKIQYGVGRRCVNPQVPVSLAGYFNKRMWDHVLDDLEVRALVMKSGSTYAAIIHFDLITVPTALYENILADIRELGIDKITRENILITATHTHTGPELRCHKPGANQEYPPFAARMGAEALKDALAELKDGELEGGLAEEHRFIFNRRYWMKDGKVVTNPGKLNPDILRPEGDIDPEIPMLAIRSNGKLAVLIANIVNHTDTIGGTGVSADWAGFFRRSMQEEMGPGSMAIALIGCAGNINHFDTRTDMNQTCYEEAKRVGTGYAETVKKALGTLKPIEGEGIQIVFGDAQAGPREISREELDEAEAICAKYPEIDVESLESTVDLTSEDLARGTPFALKYFANTLVKMANNKTPVVFHLIGFQFGKCAVLASLPSEPFIEIGLELRKGIFGGKLCLVSSHGNGTGGMTYSGGYIPNPWNYGRGGYEPTPRSNPFSMKTADILLAAWRRLAEKLN